MSDLEITNAAKVNEEVASDAAKDELETAASTETVGEKRDDQKDQQPSDATVTKESGHKSEELPVADLEIKKPAAPNLSDLGASKRLNASKSGDKPISSPLEAISVSQPKSNLSLIPPIPQHIPAKLPAPLGLEEKKQNDEPKQPPAKPEPQNDKALSKDPSPVDPPHEDPVCDDDEDNFMKETSNDIGSCKTMAFDFDADGNMNLDELSEELTNHGQIGECRTMSFDFDSSAMESASPTPVSKPLIQFGEDEDPDDDDMYISVNPQPSNPVPKPNSSGRAIIADDDEIIRSSELDAVSTYEEEGFKKSLFFERAVSRWEHASKYELPKIGDTVANYKIESLLGQGGFGAVYRVKNLTLGREEALKLILPSAKQDVSNIDKRFKREVDIVSRLEHPNVVRLYSSGSLSQGVLWMTMELVKGKSLDKIMQERRLTFMEAKTTMEQILCGLQEAHALKLIHRDLKPANIIITDKSGFAGLAVILDFGLAKALGDGEDQSVQELTMVDDSKRVYGTPAYMAPEQLQAGIPGPWTDVYAAGLMLVELITGHNAVSGNTALELAFRQIHEPLILPQKWQGTAIAAIITKATAKAPGERYKDAGEFLKDLMRVNALSDPVSVLQRPLRPATHAISLATPVNENQPKPLKPQKTEQVFIEEAVEKRTRSLKWLGLLSVAIIGWISFLLLLGFFLYVTQST